MEEILFPLSFPAHSAGRQICHLPRRVFKRSIQEPDVKSPRRVEWANLVLSIPDEVPWEIGSSFHNLVLDDEHLCLTVMGTAADQGPFLHTHTETGKQIPQAAHIIA